MHDTSFCILLKLYIKRHWCCRTKQSVRIEGIYHSNKSWFKFKFLRQSMHLRFQYYYVMQKLTPVVDGENLLFQVVTTIWCIQKGFNCLVDTHTYHIHAIPSVKRKQYHISKKLWTRATFVFVLFFYYGTCVLLNLSHAFYRIPTNTCRASIRSVCLLACAHNIFVIHSQ